MGFCVFNCGGSPGPVQETKTDTQNHIKVITNVSGAPINIAVGADFLKPVAETFRPITEGVQKGIETLSEQAQSISSQSQSVIDFTKQTGRELEKSNAALSMRQNDLETLIKLMLAVTLAGLGYQFLRSSGRA